MSVSEDGTEYDAILIMSTYRRNELLRKTLAQLRNEKTRYRVKLLVLNDGNSLHDMEAIVKENPQVLFLHNLNHPAFGAHLDVPLVSSTPLSH